LKRSIPSCPGSWTIEGEEEEEEEEQEERTSLMEGASMTSV
jgi:hypothetical protein